MFTIFVIFLILVGADLLLVSYSMLDIDSLLLPSGVRQITVPVVIQSFCLFDCVDLSRSARLGLVTSFVTLIETEQTTM